MSSLGSPSPFFLAGKKGYEVKRSLRFNGADSANLTRTSSSASTTFTYSVWLKRTKFTGYQYIFSMSGRGFAFHTNTNSFYLYDANNLNESTAKFRDPNAWYHIVVQINSGTATSYVNNELVHNAVGGGAFTLTTTANATRIGSYEPGYYYFEGYMAEINLVDGLVLAPSSFAETDAITGQWIPKKYVGSYGTNGFYLNFLDNSGTTATTLGKDSSGNGNNFTPNNFVTGDVVKDSPTNNFATLNVLSKSSGVTTQEGNLYAQGSSAWRNIVANFHMSSGKWYWEIYIKQVGTAIYGIMPATRGNNRQDFYADIYTGTYSDEWGYRNNGYLYNSASANTTWGDSYTTGDILSFALDMDNGTLDIKKNNSTTGSQITGISTTKEYRAAFTYYTSGTQSNINFGQDSTFAGQKTAQGNTDGNGKGDFYYAPPSGYKALCSANLPDPTIKLPNKHFDTVLYTGDGSSSRTFSNVLQFQPDWIWLKIRSAAYSHLLYDAVRGAGSLKAISSSTAGTEGSPADNSTYGFLSSFDANGFTVTNGSAGTTYTNQSSATYVAWNWNGGNSDSKTYTVTVVSDSGNKYRFDGFGTSAVTLDLAEGGTYIFNYPSAHPFRFSTTSDGTHGGGTEYTTGVTVLSSTSVQIVVAASAPQLHYFCTIHSGMGGAINTNSTLGSSNFDGSLQATVKANTTAGFSIGTYTAQSSGSATVGHGLAIAPDVVITKSRTVTSNWYIYHKDIGQDGWILFTSGAATTSNSAVWNPAPTSSVFTYGSGLVNQGNIVFYAFSEVAGYSKFGSYTGNGSTDGTFVFTGFRPAFILWKPSTQAATNWVMVDNKRDTFNVVDAYLLADVGNNVSGAEGDLDLVDFLSNGFKLRQVSGNNESGQTIIYLAFAESPFKNARAR